MVFYGSVLLAVDEHESSIFISNLHQNYKYFKVVVIDK